MALLINDNCTACDACKPVCPNEAISVGDPIYVIDPLRCTECVGAEDEPQCKLVCPADCIVAESGFRGNAGRADGEVRVAARLRIVHRSVRSGMGVRGPPGQWSSRGRPTRSRKVNEPPRARERGSPQVCLAWQEAQVPRPARRREPQRAVDPDISEIQRVIGGNGVDARQRRG